MKELTTLTRYAKATGYPVRFVTSKTLMDYGAMNPEAAKVMGFTDSHHEIEIDKTLPKEKQAQDLRHEIIEKNLMKSGQSYWDAHTTALKLEKSPIGARELTALAKVGAYTVSHVHDDGDLTVTRNGQSMVVTTTGKIFKETDMRDEREGTEYGMLTSEERSEIPSREFALPGVRKYPIHDASHARNALARVSQFGDRQREAGSPGSRTSEIP